MTDTDATLAPTDPRSVFAGAVVAARNTVAAVGVGQLGLPTPCDEFDVRTLLGHMLTVLGRVALMGEGGDPLSVPPVVTGVADEGWDDAFLTAAHRVQAAWTDDATLDRLITLPWAQAPGRGMLGLYASELTVHTWDLAQATGQQPEWNSGVLEVALAASRQALPDGDREAMFEQMKAKLPPVMAASNRPFGNPLTAEESAAPIDRLVSWYGRRPA